MSNLKYEFNGITEFKNEMNSNNIEVYLYTLPIKDINNKHVENYSIIKELKKLNKDNKEIVFNEYIIGSFKSISKWGDIKYIKSEHRIIKSELLTERKILERLLLENIKNSINESRYEIKRDSSNSRSVYIKNPLIYKNNLILKRKIDFDINVELNGDIIVGFNLSHSFDYINTLDKEIQLDNIKSGDRVKDYYFNKSYIFKSVASFTISEENEYMKNSIVDYHKNKGDMHIISNLDPNMKAVLVENNEGIIFPYIPNRLKKVCDYSNLPGNMTTECNKYIKLSSHDRMKESIDATLDILDNCEYIRFSKNNMRAESLGYKKDILNKPKFIFGNGNTHNTILYGLPQLGSYENKEIKISYFIDPEIYIDKNKIEKVKSFTKELEELSRKIGVTIKRESTMINFKNIEIENEDLFESEIRDIVDKYKNTAVFIMENSNSQKYYNLIKKIFGNRNNIATQFIELSTLNYNSKNKDSIFLNILLGIYGKSGVQPWILQEPLNADCFIGLDVSRENKLNTAGIIKVIGKDGRILKSKSITSSQTGEKIKIETIKEILHEAKSSYKKVYGESLKHIVFHRDGISREELNLLKETSANLGIKFDYVEITKNIQRRIAKIDNINRVWETEIGSYYLKDNKSYIVTTSPYKRLGMANPIRVTKVYGEQNIDNIVRDVYKLSFMHIGSILKSRLPVTTYYADLSSTFGNRELMPGNIESNSLHFI